MDIDIDSLHQHKLTPKAKARIWFIQARHRITGISLQKRNLALFWEEGLSWANNGEKEVFFEILGR